MLVARIVGRSGEVVAIDRDGRTISRARARAAEAGLHNINFVQTDIAEYSADSSFDAAVGRCILQFVPDPVAALRSVAKQVRPDGIVAFQEVSWAPCISLSAHLPLEFMREVRSVVGDRGLFLIYETASPDGEDRDAWLLRWVRQNQPLWTALTLEEYEGMRDHVRAYDFPETTSRWHSLGREAGFGRVRELFVAPTDFFRMYCFQA
jgi:ubiquinone/menaquinone biosynthesis C-methylase UbiE